MIKWLSIFITCLIITLSVQNFIIIPGIDSKAAEKAQSISEQSYTLISVEDVERGSDFTKRMISKIFNWFIAIALLFSIMTGIQEQGNVRNTGLIKINVFVLCAWMSVLTMVTAFTA